MFDNIMMKINQDVALKSIIFGMVFYIISSPMFIIMTDKYIPNNFSSIIVRTILFAMIYYLIENVI
jgi:hypothetical protein